MIGEILKIICVLINIQLINCFKLISFKGRKLSTLVFKFTLQVFFYL